MSDNSALSWKALWLHVCCLLIEPLRIAHGFDVEPPPTAHQPPLMRLEKHHLAQGLVAEASPTLHPPLDTPGNAVVVVSADGVSPAIGRSSTVARSKPSAQPHTPSAFPSTHKVFNPTMHHASSQAIVDPTVQHASADSGIDLVHEAAQKAAVAEQGGVSGPATIRATKSEPSLSVRTKASSARRGHSKTETAPPSDENKPRVVGKLSDRLTASKNVLPVDHILPKQKMHPLEESASGQKIGSAPDEWTTSDTVMSVDSGLANAHVADRIDPDRVGTHSTKHVKPHKDSMRTTAMHIPVPVTSDANVHPRSDKAAAQARDEPGVLWLGEGVGSMTYDRSPSGSRKLNHVMRRRLEIQDLATVILLLLAFFATVFVSLLSVYSVSEDPSPVLFYSDPKFFRQRLICHDADMDSFLAAFNTQPQTARLRVVGRSGPIPTVGGLICQFRLGTAVRLLTRKVCLWLIPDRRGRNTPWDPVVFDICLDLTPFITGNGELGSTADRETLEQHIQSANPMEVCSLVKQVHWECWEDVATNIRQRLRTLGFSGDVEVQYEATEEVLIYRNLRWQNFVRSKITQCLIMISILPAFVWIPYLWCRSRRVRVETRFQITLDLERYWEHVSECLHATEGFQGAAFASMAVLR